MPTDEQLMAAYVAGDHHAFDQLFDRFAPLLRRMFSRHLRQREDVSELVQQSFLQLHRARADYRQGQPLRPWLITIALNLQREYFRRKGRRPEVLVADEPLVANRQNPHQHSGAEGIDRHQRRQRLHAALHRLPAAQRDVIEMHWFDGLSFPEVSSVLGLSLSAVKVRAHRGYQALRHLLETAPNTGSAPSSAPDHADGVTVGSRPT